MALVTDSVSNGRQLVTDCTQGQGPTDESSIPVAVGPRNSTSYQLKCAHSSVTSVLQQKINKLLYYRYWFSALFLRNCSEPQRVQNARYLLGSKESRIYFFVLKHGTSTSTSTSTAQCSGKSWGHLVAIGCRCSL